jgi:hypothetical protein
LTGGAAAGKVDISRRVFTAVQQLPCIADVRKWIRRTLRRSGIDLPFKDVICTEQLKTISVDAKWRATVTVQSTLAFLDIPEDGDLRDVLPIDSKKDFESAIHESPDAREIHRRPSGASTVVYWRPRDGIIRYASYLHQQSWSSPGWDGQASLYTEFQCEMRTGIQTLEIVAPVVFETAVAFKRPRWPRLSTERRLVKYALAQLEAPRESRPVIRDNGLRVQWRVIGPKVGERYVCIVFSAGGVAQWQQRLKETSFAARMRGLFRRPATT